jgi:mono/diheme cytochrome c family protein
MSPNSRSRSAVLLALPAFLAAAAARPDGPDGSAIYAGKGNCAICHGRTGAGTTMGPDLTDGSWLHIDGSVDSIAALVKRGVPEPLEVRVAMPPRGGAALSDDEVDAVARYVYELSH